MQETNDVVDNSSRTPTLIIGRKMSMFSDVLLSLALGGVVDKLAYSWMN